MKICKKCKEPMTEHYDLCFRCEYMPRELEKRTRQLNVTSFITCKRCRQRIALNGPRRNVQCPRCFEIHTLHPEDIASAMAMASRGVRVILIRGQEFVFQINDAPGPRCCKCNKVVPVLENLDALGKGRDIYCASCGAEVPCHDAPDWLQVVLPNALSIVKAYREGFISPERTILFRCISCGAGLSCKTGNGRLMNCSHCGRDLFLSDDAWRIINSVQVAHPWSITYRGKFLRYEAARKSIQNAAKPEESIPGIMSVSFYDFCIRCGSSIAINGPVRVVRCRECGTMHRIDQCLQAECLAAISEGHVTRFFKGMRLPGNVYAYHEPQCHYCDHPIDITGYVREGDFTRQILCPKCGKELPQFPVPGWLRRHLPGARLLIGAEPEELQKEYCSVEELQPLTFMSSCAQCGAENELTVDELSPRLNACGSCGAAAPVPGEIWRRFHPVRRIRRWSMLFEPPALVRREFILEKIHDYINWDLRHFIEDRWERVPQGVKKFLSWPAFLRRKKALSVVMRIVCPNCGSPVYLNGPAQSAMCGVCGIAFAPDPGEFASRISLASEDAGLMFDTDFIVEHWWRRTIPCNGCSAPVRIPVSVIASGKPVEVRCRKCDAVMRGGSPPQWFRELLPGVRGIFNADDVGVRVEESHHEIPGRSVGGLDCPGCGQNIILDSSSDRIMNCGHCGNEVYIPDRIWRTLHPVTRSRRWTVVFSGKKIGFSPDDFT